MNRELLHLYILEYEKNFSQIHNKEIYKWQAVKQFQDTWHPETSNFAEMLDLSLSKTKNLMAATSYYPRKMIVNIAKTDPETVRKLFVNLFDMEKDVLERIATFHADIKDISSRVFPKMNNYQDHRAILVYLNLKYPDYYFLYKFEMFQSFCEKIEYDYRPRSGSISNIVQFLNLCTLVREEILQNNKLLKFHERRLGEAEYFDSSFNILTQDFIYAVTKHLVLNNKPRINIQSKLVLRNVMLNPFTKKYKFRGQYIDQASRQKQNKHIGDLGELAVLKYEKESCSPRYVDKITHSSKTQGDGLGYDILSYDESGNEKYIEVKTTKGNKHTAFYISGTELERSKVEAEKYYLYRLYNFDENEQKGDLFILQGDLSKYCINPTEYEVSFTP